MAMWIRRQKDKGGKKKEIMCESSEVKLMTMAENCTIKWLILEDYW